MYIVHRNISPISTSKCRSAYIESTLCPFLYRLKSNTKHYLRHTAAKPATRYDCDIDGSNTLLILGLGMTYIGSCTGLGILEINGAIYVCLAVDKH